MRSYQQYCPIARGAEIFATRWTPIIVRNLLVGCSTFSEIAAGAPGMSRSVLSERLRQLENYGIVRRARALDGRIVYELTDAGKDLAAVCDALGEWGARWVELGPQHLDPYFALWSLCKEINPSDLPEERLTVRFDLTNVRAHERRFWVLLQQPEPEICVNHPGYDEDLVVQTDPRALVEWRLRRTTLSAAMRSGSMNIDGTPTKIRQLDALASAS